MGGSIDPLPAGLPEPALGLFTTRAGGVSRGAWAQLNLASHVGDDPEAVAANRDLVSAQLRAADMVFLDQAHGTDVVVVDAAPVGDPPTSDGLVTARAGVALVVLVADCLPVLLADPVHGVVGAAHAGRRGLAAGVLQNTAAAMTRLGAVMADTTAVIGPGVCGRCYEVPESMRTDVAAAVPGTASSTRHGTPALDLPAGAARVLADLGVAAVRRTDVCTLEDPRFYSFRRDGMTGRQAGLVMLAA